MYVLELPTGKKIEMKWGTWAMKRTCELRGMSLMDLLTTLEKGSFDLSFIIAIMQSCAEYPQYKAGGKHIQISDIEVCEWIDECGGIGSEQIQGVFKMMLESMTATSAFPAKKESGSKKK